MNVALEQLLDVLEAEFPSPPYGRHMSEDGIVKVVDKQTGAAGSVQLDPFNPVPPSDVVRWLRRQLDQ